MDSIINKHRELKKKYDNGESPVDDLCDISLYCLNKLNTSTNNIDYGVTSGKSYTVFTNEKFKSRPIDCNIFISKPSDFKIIWNKFIKSIDPKNNISSLKPSEDINRVIYTAIMSFAACFDIWKNSSRKTPGTHFEILLGSILSLFLPSFERLKFIKLPNQREKVSTDIVFDNGKIGIVIPAKITTRERIVQPYAHQRILDSIFGLGRYKSILLCVSETQRDDKNIAVNEICVPGTIKLFQAHLSSLSGLYYIDPPKRYLNDDITNLIPVGNYSTLLQKGLQELISDKSE